MIKNKIVCQPVKKILLILSVLLYFPMAGFITYDGGYEWKAPANGFIDITVESNVNRLFFTYPLREINLHDDDEPAGQGAETAKIIVPVKDFRCANETALRDFLALLRADRYPDLSITIPQNVLIQYHHNEQITIENVTISIAGVSKKYDITGRIEDLNSNDHLLVGTINISLADLEIEPPVKFFGLVKIKDEVIVKFGISLKDYNLAVNKYQD